MVFTVGAGAGRNSRSRLGFGPTAARLSASGNSRVSRLRRTPHEAKRLHHSPMDNALNPTASRAVRGFTQLKPDSAGGQQEIMQLAAQSAVKHAVPSAHPRFLSTVTYTVHSSAAGAGADHPRSPRRVFSALFHTQTTQRARLSNLRRTSKPPSPAEACLLYGQRHQPSSSRTSRRIAHPGTTCLRPWPSNGRDTAEPRAIPSGSPCEVINCLS